jgi:nitrite reductase (NO-forming)
MPEENQMATKITTPRLLTLGALGVALTIAGGALPTAAQSEAPDLSGLQRVHVELVAPPFVHEHEQVATRETLPSLNSLKKWVV